MKCGLMTKRLVGIGIFALTLLPCVGSAADIEVTLKGYTETGGLQVALYDSEAGYKTEKMFGGVQMKAHTKPMRVVFADVPPGTYAIAAFHDKNENEELDANMLGVPTEAYGFSNNARGTFGLPSFEDVSFAVDGAPLKLAVELK